MSLLPVLGTAPTLLHGQAPSSSGLRAPGLWAAPAKASTPAGSPPCPGLALGDLPLLPQRCCPARGMLRSISERVETHPLLRLSLVVLTVGSLLTIAIVNMVGSGGQGRVLARPPHQAHFLGGGSLMLGTSRS